MDENSSYILCADIHAHNWTQFAQTNKDGVNSRLQDILDAFEAMCESAEDGQTVYIAGDVFHVRGQMKPSVLNPLAGLIARMNIRKGLKFRIMPGNHDLEGKNCEWLGASVVALDGGSVEIFTDPTICDDHMVAMLPWCATREAFDNGIRDLCEQIEANKDKVGDYDLIIHAGINGVLFGIPDHGFEAEELADLGFKRVFAGHYHNHKPFLFEDCDVVSIGALTHQTWSDVGTRAGWIHVSVDGGKYSFVESPAPRFMDFDPKLKMESYRGHYVRVRDLDLEDDELATLRDGLKEYAKGVVVFQKPKSTVTERKGAAVSGTLTLEESISAWVQSAEIENEKEVEAEAIDVLNEARSWV